MLKESAVGAQYYATQLGAYDEMYADRDHLLPYWQQFMAALNQLGGDELERRRTDAQRMLLENGVSYNVYGDVGNRRRPWRLDPIPLLIGSQEWSSIESGLIQRADLLDLILADIYGPQKLIKKGLLPLELIYAHEGFLRPCVGTLAPKLRHLIIYSANLARGPDGRMWVLDDRTQAPSGAGYALENRTVMSRILPSLFRDSHVHRLAVFFRALRSGLAHIAPHNKDDPRVVFLTPGPYNEAYFEHAYLASYLGYPLAQGDDLVVRERRVWLKSLEGLQPIDVIIRRVDDNFCDPLELRSDSRLGIAGLLEVVRDGNVAIANPVGSSVLENAGLLAFLPGLARYFLGRDLKLPSVATWWCGQQREREFVLQNIDRLVIKPISRRLGGSVFGAHLSAKEKDTWRQRIRAKPYLYVGQEQVSFSTAPALVDGVIEPRYAILRSFVTARDQDYVAMPGGLTRIAPQQGAYMVSYQAGGISKDTWVLASEPEKQVSLWLQPRRDQLVQPMAGPLPSQAADNLFWAGRYIERIEAIARLLRTAVMKLRETQELGNKADKQCLHALLRALTHVSSTYPGFTGKDSAAVLAAPQRELLEIAKNGERSGTLPAAIQGFAQSAFSLRDRWSLDTWRNIGDIQRHWQSRVAETDGIEHLQDHLNDLVAKILAFGGSTNDNMVREHGWLMLMTGRRLERALLLIALLRAAVTQRYDEALENQVLEAVLSTTESSITYRRRYRSYIQLPTLLELLLLDGSHPRSLVFQLQYLEEHVKALPREHLRRGLSVEERLVLKAYTGVRLADIVAVTKIKSNGGVYTELDRLLAETAQCLYGTSQAISQTYFTHAQGVKQKALTQLGYEM